MGRIASQVFGLSPRTPKFGAAASVLRYNTRSPIPVLPINRIFGIHLLSPHGVPGDPILLGLGLAPLGVVEEAWRFSGVILKEPRANWGARSDFWVFSGVFRAGATLGS